MQPCLYLQSIGQSYELRHLAYSLHGFLSIPPKASFTYTWTCQAVCSSSMQDSPIPNSWFWSTQKARVMDSYASVCSLEDRPEEEAYISLWNRLHAVWTENSGVHIPGFWPRSG